MFPAITSTAASQTSVAPIPTVIPGLPTTQELGVTGKRTLWYDLYNSKSSSKSSF